MQQHDPAPDAGDAIPRELLAALAEDARRAAHSIKEQRAERVIDHAVWETFPASDPIAVTSLPEEPEPPAEAETLTVSGGSDEAGGAPAAAPTTYRYEFELDGVPLEMEVRICRRR